MTEELYEGIDYDDLDNPASKIRYLNKMEV